MAHLPASTSRPLALLALLGAGSSASLALTLAEVPLSLGSGVKPNLLVVYDNSPSMEYLLPQTLGPTTTFTDTRTRGNTARSILRQSITQYQDQFRWGFATFAINGSPYYAGVANDPLLSIVFYSSPATGAGAVLRTVQDNSATHYNALMGLLANETNSLTTTELKNASYGTPLAGGVKVAYDYYSNALSGGGQPSPITDKACQRNYVVLATDGQPNVRVDATLYTAAEINNTQNPDGSWTWGQAAKDVHSRIGALRATTVTGTAAVNGTYDIKTYVIGIGEDIAANQYSASMDHMAQLGGTGNAYFAADSTQLTSAFASITADISARSSAGSAVSMNAGSWRSGSAVYQGRFNSGDWSGQLLAYTLGSDGSLAATASWDAAQRLNAQNWSTGRDILTYKSSAALGSRGVALRWPANAASPGATEIDSSLVTALNKDASGNVDNFGSQRLAWLRGDTSRELRNCASCAAPLFRNRPTTVLGDVINSAPVYVNGGGQYVRDSAQAAAYSSYKTTRLNKPALVFVGANDGMLHAFNASTGDEVFAYVPAAVTSRLSQLTSQAYSHRYTVDGSPVVADVFYASAWHSVLVSGMAAGGQGLFALDVSDPDALDEAHASSVVRWELGNSDADVGNIFQQPVIAKMKNGRWMAITGNGYNSSNGHAVLLLVDVETGAVTKVDTKAGSSGSPNGLSAVVAVSSANNGVADIVYAGDLAGNLWKFDLSSSTASNWAVSYGNSSSPKPLYAAGSTQPITARPDVSPHPSGGYQVVFGSGSFIDTSDGSNTATQSLYGLWDSGSLISSSSSLVTQSVLGTANGVDTRNYRITTYAVGTPSGTVYSGDNSITSANYLANKRGWKLNLPTSGERVVTQAAVRYGKVVVSTLIPSTNACTPGGDGWVMELDLTTGNRANTSSLDTNGDNQVTTADILSYGGGSAYASGVRIGAIPSAPGFIRAQNRSLDDKLINTSDGSVVRVREAGSSAVSGRASWEQLQ